MTWTTRYALESMMGRSVKTDNGKVPNKPAKLRLSQQFMTLNSNGAGSVMVRRFNSSEYDDVR